MTPRTKSFRRLLALLGCCAVLGLVIPLLIAVRPAAKKTRLTTLSVVESAPPASRRLGSRRSPDARTTAVSGVSGARSLVVTVAPDSDDDDLTALFQQVGLVEVSRRGDRFRLSIAEGSEATDVYAALRVEPMIVSIAVPQKQRRRSAPPRPEVLR